jgi:hypothetical protein
MEIMADFGGDGIKLRGLAGKRLEEQQKKDLEDFLKELNDPLLIGKLKDREKKAKGGIARGCGKIMSNRKKTTKYY